MDVGTNRTAETLEGTRTVYERFAGANANSIGAAVVTSTSVSEDKLESALMRRTESV